jgi:hypothetical protein
LTFVSGSSAAPISLSNLASGSFVWGCGAAGDTLVRPSGSSWAAGTGSGDGLVSTGVGAEVADAGIADDEAVDDDSTGNIESFDAAAETAADFAESLDLVAAVFVVTDLVAAAVVSERSRNRIAVVTAASANTIPNTTEPAIKTQFRRLGPSAGA